VVARRFIPAVVVFMALLGAACGEGTEDPAAMRGPGVVIAGSASRLASAIRSKRPKPLVVNYWATWCDPCRKEMPRLVDAAGRYGKRVAFIGVNVEDDRTAAQAFARRYGIPFRSYAMSKAEVQRAQDILGLPVTQFFRADGELAFVHQGEISADDLDAKIEELLRIGRPVSRP
jgi:thiol-disulfide isomerase/thioredoxin